MAKERERFKYEARDKSDVEARANQRGGVFDSYLIEGVKIFSTKKEGDYTIRVLPPPSGMRDVIKKFNAGKMHYGIDIYVHYDIGSSSYLCRDKMLGEPCPVCEERTRADRAGGDPDYARSLNPSKRVLCYVIDRSKEGSGPQVWAMPFMLDKDFAKLSDNKKKGLLQVDHPDKGNDIDFSKEGTGKKVKYTGIRIDPDSSPLSEDPDEQDEWLDYIQDNPLPDLLNYYEYDHIKAAFEGGRAAPKGDDGGERRRPRDDDTDARRRPRDDEAEERPSRRSRAEPEPEPEPEGRRARRSRDDDTAADPEERPARRSRVAAEEPTEEDERPARRSRAVAEEPTEDPEERPARRGRAADDDERPARRSRAEEPAEDDPPPRRGRARDDDAADDERPARRSRASEEPAEEEVPRGRMSIRERVAAERGKQK